LKSSYKLRIEKVYLCSTIDGHVPIYDPDGTFYKRGPQFGCAEPHISLSERFLLLDRNNTNEKGSPFDVHSFNPKFISDKHVQKSEINKIIIIDGFTLNVEPLFQMDQNETKNYRNWYIQVFFYIGPASTIDSFKNSNKKENTKFYSNMYNFTNIYNNGTNIQKLKLTHKERSTEINKLKLSSKTGGKMDLERQLKISNKDTLFKFIIPIIILVLVLSLLLIAILLFKKYKNINNRKSPPFPVNSSPSSSSNSTIVIVASKAEYMPKDGSIQTKLLKSDPFSDDSNCTLQTVISSSTSSTNSHSNMLSNESYSVNSNHQVCNKNISESGGLYSSDKLKTFFKKMYAPVPTESDESTNYAINRYTNFNNSNKSGSNYLYFNYNNTDLNLNANEATKVHSSTRSLVINNTGNSKRLSGTEV
jgi:hypothetical protein